MDKTRKCVVPTVGDGIVVHRRDTHAWAEGTDGWMRGNDEGHEGVAPNAGRTRGDTEDRPCHGSIVRQPRTHPVVRRTGVETNDATMRWHVQPTTRHFIPTMRPRVRCVTNPVQSTSLARVIPGQPLVGTPVPAPCDPIVPQGRSIRREARGPRERHSRKRLVEPSTNEDHSRRYKTTWRSQGSPGSHCT